MGMPPWRLRDFHEDDLDQAISVWDQSRSRDETHPVFGVSEVISAARSGQPAVVAVIGDELVGMAAAQPQGERAWISVIALSHLWRNGGIGSALLGELENRSHRRLSDRHRRYPPDVD
jgi:transitional endoplasmic reticulum ATPase